MASHSQDSYSPIHFYKVILKTNLETIMLPRKFTGRYGRCLSSPVHLKPPDGKEWKVYWKKRDNEVWFHKGWKEFVNFYSLDAGYLVLFKYGGTCQLGVHIIDKSGLEIDYPLSMIASSQGDNIDHLSDDLIEILDEMPLSPEENLGCLSDDAIEILDEMPSSPEAGHNMPSLSSRLHKKRRTTTDEDVEMRSFNLQNMLVGMKTKGREFQGTKLQNSINGHSKFSKQKSEGDTGTRIFNNSGCLNSEHRREEVVTAVEKNKAFQSASFFNSDNPFFMVVMKPSYVGPNFYLPIPKEFAGKCLKEEFEVVQLHTLDGRIWRVQYKIPRLVNGWRKFVKENGLKVGHACVFEMIDLSSFKVHIFRDTEKGNLKVNSFEKEQRSSMQDPPLDKASSSQSKNPRFTVMMTQAHIHGTSYMRVPNEFAKAHLGNNTKSVTLVVQDKDWTVGYAFRSYDKQRSAEFSWGWKQFCKDNDLKAGDVCEFVLTQKFKFQVTIYRVAP